MNYIGSDDDSGCGGTAVTHFGTILIFLVFITGESLKLMKGKTPRSKGIYVIYRCYSLAFISFHLGSARDSVKVYIGYCDSTNI